MLNGEALLVPRTRMRHGEYALLCMAYTQRYSHTDTEYLHDDWQVCCSGSLLSRDRV